MARFEIVDRCETAIGPLTLRRRWHPVVEVDVWEVILGEEHLMSSLFTASEDALGRLPLQLLDDPVVRLDVVVGGLGLGYTAAAVLDDARVAVVRVVEALPAVIEWHERGAVPLGARLAGDERCTFVEADFFALVADGQPFGPGTGTRHHAILVDIDHTPDHHLAEGRYGFYRSAGLARVAERLHPGGVFGLWSDADPDDAFLTTMRTVFPVAEAHEVRFPNPLTGGEATNTVYVGVHGQWPPP